MVFVTAQAEAVQVLFDPKLPSLKKMIRQYLKDYWPGWHHGDAGSISVVS